MNLFPGPDPIAADAKPVVRVVDDDFPFAGQRIVLIRFGRDKIAGLATIPFVLAQVIASCNLGCV